MESLDEKHIEMLRTNLSVYEVDSIQCQLTFEKKTITLDVGYNKISTYMPYNLLISDFYFSQRIAVRVLSNMIKIKFHYIFKNKFVNLIILILPVNWLDLYLKNHLIQLFIQ